MLLELVVENYAVVERLRVHFHSGLNLLTGETGSGKSIVVDALGLLLGGRASAEMIRTGEARARVAGIFEVRDQAAVRRLLEPAGLEVEDGELLIEREILASGKSRAFVGSRPVAVALLKDLAPLLGDIHGQHDQQLLFSREAQRDMLDAFAGNRELLDSAARLYQEWRGGGRGVGGTGAQRAGEAAAAGSVEFPAQGDRERRAGSRTRTRNWRTSGGCCRTCRSCRRARGDGVRCASTRARNRRWRWRALRRSGWRSCAASMPSLDGLREHLKSAELSLQEAAYALRDYLSGLEANPGRLEEVENAAGGDRAAEAEVRAIDRGDPGVSGGSARRRSRRVESAGERMEALRKEQKRLAAEFEKAGARS